jgi:hypothetical protein
VKVIADLGLRNADLIMELQSNFNLCRFSTPKFETIDYNLLSKPKGFDLIQKDLASIPKNQGGTMIFASVCLQLEKDLLLN